MKLRDIICMALLLYDSEVCTDLVDSGITLERFYIIILNDELQIFEIMIA